MAATTTQSGRISGCAGPHSIVAIDEKCAVRAQAPATIVAVPSNVKGELIRNGKTGASGRDQAPPARGVELRVKGAAAVLS